MHAAYFHLCVHEISLPHQDDDEEFAPENVTFAPKDVTPVDFNPRLGVQGLGYRGLDPSLALLGHGTAEHIDLFKPQSETRNRLFGDTKSSSRRGGVVGQVSPQNPEVFLVVFFKYKVFGC